MGTPGHNVLRGTPGADVIVGLAGNDTVYGGGGNDSICGQKGKDTIYAEDGDDSVYGGKGNDKLFGGTGKDLLGGNAGSDALNGGGDYGDATTFFDATGPVTVNLTTGQATGFGTGSLTGIANVEGSAYSDRITGDPNHNELFGLAGNDHIDGGGADRTGNAYADGDRHMAVEDETLSKGTVLRAATTATTSSVVLGTTHFTEDQGQVTTSCTGTMETTTSTVAVRSSGTRGTTTSKGPPVRTSKLVEAVAIPSRATPPMTS